MSPTQRTLAKLKKDGWTVQVVEHWNPFARVRQDLFGFIDVLAIKPGMVLGVQTTSGSNVSARLEKAKTLSSLKVWLQAGAFLEVWGWRKTGPRGGRKTWAVRRVILSQADLG